MRKRNKNQPEGSDPTRRVFIRDVSLAAVGMGLAGSCACAKKQQSSGLLHRDTMRYRILGRTGLNVSEIGLGGHYDGPKRLQKRAEEQWQRNAVFQECLKSGINYYDTNTEQERESFGRALKTMLGCREKIVIVTDINDQEGTGQAMYDFMMKSIDEQLSTLQLPSVDILRYTTVAMKTPPERIQAAIQAFKAMKRAGKTRYFAVAQHDPDLLLKWIKQYEEIDVIYTPYNYFMPKAEEELFPEAKKRNMGVIVIKPFNKGFLFNPKLIETMAIGKGIRSIIERIQREGKNRTAEDLIGSTRSTLAQASLRYILSNENISTVIPGMETVDEVFENRMVERGDSFGKTDQDVLEHFAAHVETVLPENYQWLKRWRHA